MAAVRHFFTKVAGVIFQNDDDGGSSRQEIIGQCRLYERLILDHDEKNAHDKNAVHVCRQNDEGEAGEQLGYLNRRLAEEVVAMSAKGYRFGVFISGLTGGHGRKKSRGVNLLVVRAEPGMSDEEAQAYANRLVESGELDREARGAKRYVYAANGSSTMEG